MLSGENNGGSFDSAPPTAGIFTLFKPRASFVRRKEKIGVKKIRKIRGEHPTYVDGLKKKGGREKLLWPNAGWFNFVCVFGKKNEVADRQAAAAAKKKD